MELDFVGCDSTASLVFFEDESGRACDLVFESDAGKQIIYMMESDIRALAYWILENTNEN